MAKQLKTIGMFQGIAGIVALGSAVWTNNLTVGVGILGLAFLVTGYYNATTKR